MNDFSARPPSVCLSELAKRLLDCGPRVFGNGAVRIGSISEDSRRVEPGCLFVARRGETSDGTRFVAKAMAAGAAAVLCESHSGIEVEPRLEVRDIRRAWGLCAQALWGGPSRALRVVGITGTNGKTTVASLVAEALSTLGRLPARLGTLGFFVGEERLADSLTTPQPDQLAQALFIAKERGADTVVLEVSSHALSQQRVAGVEFAVAALTNFTQDHLDYHHTMEAYAAAKSRLFRDCAPSFRVLHVDDPLGASLSAEFSDALTVSVDGRSSARVRATAPQFVRTGLSARVSLDAQEYELRSGLLGKHNLENLLVAWGILLSLGHAPEASIQALSGCLGVPGRLERCDGPEDDIVVVVDYAHTPDALGRALVTLSELDFTQLVCVFGCGGDRDRTKRAPMGQAAKKYASHIYLTSDNPRTEDPQAILRDVLLGLAGAEDRTCVLLDRRKAISQAIVQAPAGSVVLVAGKGHEDYQLIGDRVLPFDDRVEARAALKLRREARD